MVRHTAPHAVRAVARHGEQRLGLPPTPGLLSPALQYRGIELETSWRDAGQMTDSRAQQIDFLGLSHRSRGPPELTTAHVHQYNSSAAASCWQSSILEASLDWGSLRLQPPLPVRSTHVPLLSRSLDGRGSVPVRHSIFPQTPTVGAATYISSPPTVASLATGSSCASTAATVYSGASVSVGAPTSVGNHAGAARPHHFSSQGMSSVHVPAPLAQTPRFPTREMPLGQPSPPVPAWASPLPVSRETMHPAPLPSCAMALEMSSVAQAMHPTPLLPPCPMGLELPAVAQALQPSPCLLHRETPSLVVRDTAQALRTTSGQCTPAPIATSALDEALPLRTPPWRSPQALPREALMSPMRLSPRLLPRESVNSSAQSLMSWAHRATVLAPTEEPDELSPRPGQALAQRMSSAPMSHSRFDPLGHSTTATTKDVLRDRCQSPPASSRGHGVFRQTSAASDVVRLARDVADTMPTFTQSRSIDSETRPWATSSASRRTRAPSPVTTTRTASAQHTGVVRLSSAPAEHRFHLPAAIATGTSVEAVPAAEHRFHGTSVEAIAAAAVERLLLSPRVPERGCLADAKEFGPQVVYMPRTRPIPPEASTPRFPLEEPCVAVPEQEYKPVTPPPLWRPIKSDKPGKLGSCIRAQSAPTRTREANIGCTGDSDGVRVLCTSDDTGPIQGSRNTEDACSSSRMRPDDEGTQGTSSVRMASPSLRQAKAWSGDCKFKPVSRPVSPGPKEDNFSDACIRLQEKLWTVREDKAAVITV